MPCRIGTRSPPPRSTCPASATGTPEERRPNTAVDLATVHVAIYDAVMAIAGTHRPYAITPTAAAAGASQEASVAAAAYRVLLGLFPSRAAQYQTAYDTFLATLPDGAAKTQGLAVGAEVAAGTLALRANDGRSVALARTCRAAHRVSFARHQPDRQAECLHQALCTDHDRPIPCARAAGAEQRRVRWADLNETKTLGSATSSVRTAEQTEGRALQRRIVQCLLAAQPAHLRDDQPQRCRAGALDGDALGRARRRPERLLRVQVLLSVLAPYQRHHAGRYRRQRRDHRRRQLGSAPRPRRTTPSTQRAHCCIAGALAETLRIYFGTPNVTFDLTSTFTGTTRHFTTTQSLVDENQIARIAGGIHFRTANGRRHGAWRERRELDADPQFPAQSDRRPKRIQSPPRR